MNFWSLIQTLFSVEAEEIQASQQQLLTVFSGPTTKETTELHVMLGDLVTNGNRTL